MELQDGAELVGVFRFQNAFCAQQFLVQFANVNNRYATMSLAEKRLKLVEFGDRFAHNSFVNFPQFIGLFTN